ncbi:ATP-dependent Clp protease ATP-binding subunit ClpX-like [Sycon ciliatum]|uniref:ATP-dependent Clp protease ATP-binding subunit ClpX-like n=1 Tax=Sycon ciliatum TaxID=27933 RepID=UPI0031F626EF
MNLQNVLRSPALRWTRGEMVKRRDFSALLKDGCGDVRTGSDLTRAGPAVCLSTTPVPRVRQLRRRAISLDPDQRLIVSRSRISELAFSNGDGDGGSGYGGGSGGGGDDGEGGGGGGGGAGGGSSGAAPTFICPACSSTNVLPFSAPKSVRCQDCDRIWDVVLPPARAAAGKDDSSSSSGQARAGSPVRFILGEEFGTGSGAGPGSGEGGRHGPPKLSKPPPPQKIFDHLSQHVIGQERAKKVLSVAVYNHYKRLSLAGPSKTQQAPSSEESFGEEGTLTLGRRPDGMRIVLVRPKRSDAELWTQKGFNRQHASASSTSSSSREKDSASESKKSFGDDEDEDEGVRVDKSNIIMLGPTGCGKTLLAQTLARYLDVPFAICDCTTLTQAGYVGQDIESTISRLLQEADYDVGLAERGIVFLDEIDKIMAMRDHQRARDIGGEGVQQGLLKILEGTTVNVQVKGRLTRSVDTKNILFVGSGAFNGLEEIIAHRKEEKVLGFSMKSPSDTNSPVGGEAPQTEDRTEEEIKALKAAQRKDKLLGQVEPRDLIKFGLIPEMVGRMPVIVPLQSMDEDSLVRVLTEPRHALISQFTLLLGMDKVDLAFENDALRAIAKRALENNTGARGLRSIIEKLLLESMYEVPGSNIKRVVVSADAVKGVCEPVHEYHGEETSVDTEAEAVRNA